jgi:hypothetical protein
LSALRSLSPEGGGELLSEAVIATTKARIQVATMAARIKAIFWGR